MNGLQLHTTLLTQPLKMKFSQLDGSTEIFPLTKALENGVEYNVYPNGVRIDDPNYGLKTVLVTNENAVIQSITGDGVSTTVTIENTPKRFVDGDVVVIRKARPMVLL